MARIGVGLCLPQLGDHVTLDALKRFCERAEALGYTSLWVQDHFLWPLEPVRGYAGRAGAPIPKQYQSVLAPTELLAIVAGWTTTAKLGTSILVAGNHWPVPLAQRLATIDVLSNGRLLVGLGVGWNAEEHELAGTDITTRGARMDDFIGALTACWNEDPISYHGPFFDVPMSVMRPKPVQRPRPKLLSGMWSGKGIERTRDRFDAWNPAGLTVAAVAAAAAKMNAERPVGMAPLEVYHRSFAQYPHAATPPGDVVARLTVEAEQAAEAGFTEFVMEHNFWDGVTSPEDWATVPDRFAPVLDAVR